MSKIVTHHCENTVSVCGCVSDTSFNRAQVVRSVDVHEHLALTRSLGTSTEKQRKGTESGRRKQRYDKETKDEIIRAQTTVFVLAWWERPNGTTFVKRAACFVLCRPHTAFSCALVLLSKHPDVEDRTLHHTHHRSTFSRDLAHENCARFFDQRVWRWVKFKMSWIPESEFFQKSSCCLMFRRTLLHVLDLPPHFPTALVTESCTTCADPRSGSLFGRLAEQNPTAGYEPKAWSRFAASTQWLTSLQGRTGSPPMTSLPWLRMKSLREERSKCKSHRCLCFFFCKQQQAATNSSKHHQVCWSSVKGNRTSSSRWLFSSEKIIWGWGGDSLERKILILLHMNKSTTWITKIGVVSGKSVGCLCSKRQKENIRLFGELNMKNRIYQEHHATDCQEIQESRRICCKQADRVRQFRIYELSMYQIVNPSSVNQCILWIELKKHNLETASSSRMSHVPSQLSRIPSPREECVAAILVCGTTHGTRSVLQETFFWGFTWSRRAIPIVPSRELRPGNTRNTTKHGEGLRR